MGDVTTFESAFETSAVARPRRMDVVPAGRMRRSWTPEAKARIIAESMAPRANVADIARRSDMVPQQLYAWRREARERMEAGDERAFVPTVVDQLTGPEGGKRRRNPVLLTSAD
jgi:transposase